MNDAYAPLCGLKGCTEPMVDGAYVEATVPGFGTVRVGLCLGHFDAASHHQSAHVSIAEPTNERTNP